MSDSSSDVPDWRKGTPKAGGAPDWKGKPKPEAPKTPPGKPTQAWRQDAGAGPRRFSTEVGLINDLDAHAFPRQEVGGAQADDAAANDQ